MINEHTAENAAVEFLTFDDAAEQVKQEVGRLLSASPKPIRNYTQHLTLSWGKFLRSRALLACAENREGLLHPNAVKLASAIEVLHLATLVHDDVIDNADLRRGFVTLQKKYGKRTAVICGDYLFCLALEQAASIPNKRDYLDFNIPDYMTRICLGELRQNQNNYNLDLSVASYLRIISGKTAALFEASFYAGAILCEEEKDAVEKYMRLGHLIGMIFQLTDDCIDFEAPRQLAKKPVQSDYEQGVITLPLIYAFQTRAAFKEKARAEKISREEINAAVEETGGLSYTKTVSKKYYDKAFKMIRELGASENKKERLQSILDKAYRGL
ncbi:polyprenyl synthetase family protein [Clostridium sp. KNHs216]|jgi:Geranylgeranyl pyrophosphate synthase|uniref:polyprenyl synthetase family protein n=1 Tax=Clostridium sp. KNHs216 TaxID=1550235 RepID=UPI001152350A|nr:polyprenyl synthetase family protein [Clostridium sp. KNHs216]MBE6831756.1 polyprenyl synthetase family protein [Oscillospiraceae bacterium]TQI66147.1 heptaprenyl diphosphate synthase [Clostridium sp. KNHs216]